MTAAEDPPVDEPEGLVDSNAAALEAAAALGRIDLAHNDLTAVLAAVAALAAEIVPGAADVSVTLVSQGAAGTAASTSDRALALDERQYDSGQGPCLDAAVDQAVHVIADTRHHGRWGTFCQDAAARGICSTLALGIPVRAEVTGALNLYADRVGAFDAEAVAGVTRFADHAAVTIANAHLYETTATLAAQMAQAMSSRAVIEQAKGIVIAQQKVTADEAFDIIAKASQVSNRKLRDIAQAIVDGAQRP